MSVKIFWIIILILLLASCSTNYGRYQQQSDSTPVRIPTPSELEDPIPRQEKPSRGGNKNYQVRGINYSVLKSAVDFNQTGTASWYGKKFHGHLTSNGEIYNMYSMSAAHKNLPLPTYLKVTNLTNQKSVIVRVNDRGPFHQSRIIDLSYSAAFKLDMLRTGTAEVRIEAIDYSPSKKGVAKFTTSNNSLGIETKTKAQKSGEYIQVFATRNEALAKSTASAMASLYQQEVVWPEQNGIFRVQIGPLDKEKSNRLLTTIKKSGYPNAYKRKLLQ